MFKYAVKDCDVQDKRRLVRFRELAEQWAKMMSGDPAASIAGQFGEMMWHDAAWRVANEARKFADADGPNAAIAPLLGQLLDRGYVSGQVIAITRLLEFSNPRFPEKGVISLRRLVDEVRAAREDITREVFVSRDALPYDYEAVEAKALAAVAEKAEAVGGVSFHHFPTSGPDGYDVARQEHEFFDRLSGVAPADRSRGDLIAMSFFDKLDAMLKDDLLTGIKALRNKSIAHAADEFSRNQAKKLPTGLNLVEFERAHYLLFAVYQTLSLVLLGEYRASPVPTPQHDILRHLTSPFIAEGRLEEIGNFWKQHAAEREEWSERGLHEIVPPATTGR